MRNEFTWALIVTLPEWLNWIATRQLRVAGRIVPLRGADDFDGYTRLLERAPDVRPEPSAYVLAVLAPDFLKLQSPIGGAGSADVTVLSIASVMEFQPVSEHGRQVLAPDAARAGVTLSNPVFHAHWDRWLENHQQGLADQQGQTFVEALGLGSIDPTLQVEALHLYLMDGAPIPSSRDSRSDYLGTHAAGWRDAFWAFGNLSGEERKKDAVRELDLIAQLNRLQTAQDLAEPCLADARMRGIANDLRGRLKEDPKLDISLLQLAASFYYSALLRSERRFDLSALARDLEIIRDNDGDRYAALAAFYIGRCMPAEMIATLHYDAFAEKHGFLSEPRTRLMRPLLPRIQPQAQASVSTANATAPSLLVEAEIGPVATAVAPSAHAASKAAVPEQLDLGLPPAAERGRSKKNQTNPRSESKRNNANKTTRK